MSTERVASPVTTGSLQERYAAVMMPNYGTPPVALARGDGCVAWDVDGKSYLDLIGGIAVSALGHGHPAIVAAVSEQVARLAHISNLFLHERQVELAQRLIGLLGTDGRVPVISSVARGKDGEIYNVNADTAAAALAVALDAAKLVVLTDVEGLYANWQGAGQHTADDVISLLGAAELEALLPGLSAGMIPKMEACLRAVRGGVPQAHVLDGRLPHSVLLEIFTDSGIGTMVIPDPAPGPGGNGAPS